jgi:2-keto-4-pentenoate hydratase/2-oxohepta-3-ene-1,7-dioic acid hydratase in catechol pathway
VGTVKIARARIGGTISHCEVADDTIHLLAGHPFGPLERTGVSHPLAAAELLPPVEGGRTFAVLGGFWDEGADRTVELGEPLVCPKVMPLTSGDGGEVAVWSSLSAVSMEAEMALVVGRTVRSASRAEAAAAIWGYTCCNDVTAVEHFPQFWLAKSFDGFCSLGPWVRTDLTEERIRAGLAIEGRINGATVQAGSTARYRFWPAEVVQYLSGVCTLHPGDVVTLGTPPPPVDVTVGDTVELEVEEIGVLTNHVVAG